MMMNTLAATPPRALIADDQPDVLTALRLLLKGEGYQTEAVSSPSAVLEALRRRDFDLLLMDLNYARDTTSGQEGLDLLARVQALDRTLPVVVMTAWGSVELAVEAMRRGVRDFVQKPWENARLLHILRTQIEHGRQQRRRRRLEAEQKRLGRKLRRELDEAQRVQHGLLPQEMPGLRGIELGRAWRTAREVGGDYHDVLKFSERQVALCIADVVGKGMPAALLMSNVQAAVKAFASEAVSPQELCEKVNRVICGNIAANKFITFFYGLLDAGRKRLVYANAGHNPPVLVRHDGATERLATGGAVLGVFPDWGYEQGEVELRAGDRVLLFTDGVTEVRNAAGEEFGEERLVALLAAHRALDADELQRKIMGAVTEFSGGDFQDDATLIVMAVE
jgi:sigma-B regulation protein RsbU (phosphoserine phosphatase)